MSNFLKDIEVLKLPIPHQINKEVLNHLGLKAPWRFVFHVKGEFNPSFTNVINDSKLSDSGLSLVTYARDEVYRDPHNDQYLNNFGNMIFHHVREQTKKFNMLYIDRLYWNLYSQSSVCHWHYDNQEIDHYASIVYNFHTNDGGTEFESGKIPSNEGEAIVFPSHLAHKGVAPVKHKWRLSLNIIVKIKKDELSPFS